MIFFWARQFSDTGAVVLLTLARSPVRDRQQYHRESTGYRPALGARTPPRFPLQLARPVLIARTPETLPRLARGASRSRKEWSALLGGQPPQETHSADLERTLASGRTGEDRTQTSDNVRCSFLDVQPGDRAQGHRRRSRCPRRSYDRLRCRIRLPPTKRPGLPSQAPSVHALPARPAPPGRLDIRTLRVLTRFHSLLSPASQ